MQSDEEGFLYPHVDIEKCTECGRCTKVCPALSPYEERTPLETFAAINRREDVRLRSSSDGVFPLLAEWIIDRDGVVFGAAFDKKWNVVHRKAATKAELKDLQGSKYVQSRMGRCYNEAKTCLKKGRMVMFVGTPCQIAGLQHYLGKPNPLLLTVDFICHGVPSPAVWQWYIKNRATSFSKKHWLSRMRYGLNPVSSIQSVEFRNKDRGWKHFQFVMKMGGRRGESLANVHYDNPYMRCFLLDASLRPSCYHCPSKCGRSYSDITLADFWNVHKVVDGFDDDKGTSLVIINTQRGAHVFGELDCRREHVCFEDAIQYNKAWRKPYPENPHRAAFFQEYKNRPADFHLLAEVNEGEGC